jgi:glycosyltransferase involved in cell wall biosynthesis
MINPTILISANLAWNLVNFRAGLIIYLIKQGFAVVGVAPADPIAEAKLAAMGCGFEAIKLDAKGLSPLNDLRTIFQYRKIFAKYRPVAFLGYTVKPNVYGGIAARSSKIPHIANISGLGTAFIRRNFITKIVSALYRFGLADASTVFFQNETDRELFVKLHLVQANQTHIVPGSGIDTQYFSAAPLPVRSAVNFLMIGRLLRDKGVLEYVEAARQIKVELPHVTFKLLGFLDVQNRTAISREQVNAWVNEGVIEYLPPVDDVRPHIAASDCIVLPSYREGTSRVLLEAAAMARPIIASDVPGCREVAQDGVSGILCAARDATSLASAIRTVALLSPKALTEMGSAGRNLVSQKFTQDVVNECYEQALERAGISTPRFSV